VRYNPNVDQSMKGDDVLAFDLDSHPVRVIVGEAKVRATSTKGSVQEIVTGLVRSVKAGVNVIRPSGGGVGRVHSQHSNNNRKGTQTSSAGIPTTIG
jgi:hypothetical protein